MVRAIFPSGERTVRAAEPAAGKDKYEAAPTRKPIVEQMRRRFMTFTFQFAGLLARSGAPCAGLAQRPRLARLPTCRIPRQGVSLKGTGFSPYMHSRKIIRASAPEGMLFQTDPLPILQSDFRTTTIRFSGNESIDAPCPAKPRLCISPIATT